MGGEEEEDVTAHPQVFKSPSSQPKKCPGRLRGVGQVVFTGDMGRKAEPQEVSVWKDRVILVTSCCDHNQCPEQDPRQFLGSQHICLLYQTQPNLAVFLFSRLLEGMAPPLCPPCLTGPPLTPLLPSSSDSAAGQPSRWANTQTQRWACPSSSSSWRTRGPENRREQQILGWA